jgi:hypothetical protein
VSAGLDYHARYTLPAAFSLLAPDTDSDAARALVLAIGLQESDFLARRQHGDGPARGYWQFELIAITDLLQRPTTGPALRRVVQALHYPALDARGIHALLEHHDVLAAACARLTLWTLPFPLPPRNDADLGWQQYEAAWKPGRPRRAKWASSYASAWSRY